MVESQNEEGVGGNGSPSQGRRRRVRRDASQWRALIEQQRVSGQTVKAFCAEHGLGEASFYAWRRWLAQTTIRSDEATNHADPSQSQPAEASSQSTKPDGEPSSTAADFVRLDPQADASSEAIEVRFACGATLRCSSSHLPGLVQWLKHDGHGHVTGSDVC